MARPPLDGVVLLTGASAGIGLELARLLASTARVLVLVARRADRLEALAAELRAARPALVVDVKPCDLEDDAAADAMVEAVLAAHGQVDVLINNAGFGDIAWFHKAEPERLERMIQLNVVALVRLTRRLLPDMLRRGRGGVLNVSSGFGLTWMPVMSVYVATKTFVTTFTECLRAEVAGTGVVVSQLAPGPVRTEFESNLGEGLGLYVPVVLQQEAEACARQGLRGFARGQALIIPGFWGWMGIQLGRSAPHVLLRWMYGLSARVFRDRLGGAA